MDPLFLGVLYAFYGSFARLFGGKPAGALRGATTGNINSAIPNKLDVQQAEVNGAGIKSQAGMVKKDAAAAEKLFKQAVDLGKNISYAYGPPCHKYN
jgi:hypothetical protein